MYKIIENAGALDERITITREALTPDEIGGAVPSWSHVATVWAKVAPLSGRERDMANQTESPRNYRFTVRRSAQSAAFTTKDRLTWRGKVMNIRFIADAGPRGEYMTIDAEDGVAA